MEKVKGQQYGECQRERGWGDEEGKMGISGDGKKACHFLIFHNEGDKK